MSGVYRATFNSKSQFLATRDYDGLIKLWKLDLDLSSLIKGNCDRIRNYLKYNPNVSEEDRQLCDDIGTEQKRQFWIFDW